MATTAFLFLRRVQAVYADSRLIRWFFAFLWAAASGVGFALIPGSLAEHIPGTGYCSVYQVASYVPLANFMPAIFDTLVFFAVSYRLAFQAHRDAGTQKSWTTSWFSTEGLPRLQAAVIQGGQQYYLSVPFITILTSHFLTWTHSIAFVLQFVGGILPFSDSVPPMSKVVCTVPGVALSACMACRAHRTMVGVFHQSGEGAAPVVSAMRFTPGNRSGVSNTIIELESSTIRHQTPSSKRTSSSS